MISKKRLQFGIVCAFVFLVGALYGADDPSEDLRSALNEIETQNDILVVLGVPGEQVRSALSEFVAARDMIVYVQSPDPEQLAAVREMAEALDRGVDHAVHLRRVHGPAEIEFFLIAAAQFIPFGKRAAIDQGLEREVRHSLGDPASDPRQLLFPRQQPHLFHPDQFFPAQPVPTGHVTASIFLDQLIGRFKWKMRCVVTDMKQERFFSMVEDPVDVIQRGIREEIGRVELLVRMVRVHGVFLGRNQQLLIPIHVAVAQDFPIAVDVKIDARERIEPAHLGP